MAYFQIGILSIVGLIVFGVFFSYFVDLNKDATFHNHRQKRTKPRLEVIKTKRRPAAKPMARPAQATQKSELQKKGSRQDSQRERERIDPPKRGPRSPEKRR